MNIKSILIGVFIISGLLTLSACSTTTQGSSGASGQPGSMEIGGAQALGLGAQNPIVNTAYGQRFDLRNRLRAPYNQIYFFAFDKSRIHQEDLKSIDIQANYLIAHPNARVLLIGNTDSRGSREYNIALGERRAMAVEDRLQADGVNRRQLRLLSYGSEKPIALGNTERDYALNRNVQLIYEVK